MEKETVVIETSYTCQFFSVQVDRKYLRPVPGTASEELTKGLPHWLTWHARGKPGSTYKIAITSPSDIAFEQSITLDADGKDFGLFKIQL